MDHKEQHHQHHEKEREHRKKEHRAHERAKGKNFIPVHPLWLFIIGAVMVAAAVLIWTFYVW